MYDKFNRKRLNTQIRAKTEQALQAIKGYQMMEQSKLNFNFSNSHPSKTLLNELDNDYSKLTSHRKINLNHTYKISLSPYSQEFYSLQMMNYIFPMKCIIKNVKNQGTIYIGYDQKYPGIYQSQNASSNNQILEKVKNYDFKSIVNQDIVIVLKNKGNKLVKQVYFTIVAGKSFFFCDFKVQFLGLLRDERVQSQVKLKIRQFSFQKSQKTKAHLSIPILQRTKTQGNEILSSYKQNQLPSFQNFNKPVKIQQLIVFNQGQMKKNHSRPNLEQNVFKKTNKNSIDFFKTKELLSDKTRGHSVDNSNKIKKPLKTVVDYKLDEAKRNKEMINQFKIKDKQLRETASKCKKMIENYKASFNDENVRRRKINKDLVLCLYSSIFIRQVIKRTDQQTRKESNVFKIQYICRKFVRNLKKSYRETCSILPFRSKRLINEADSGIYLLSKAIAKQSLIRADKVIRQAFIFLHPQLLVRHSISIAKKYRQSVKLIQRAWKQKYHNRLQSLLYFVDNHLHKMFKQFPHLRMFYETFYHNKSNRQICLNYIKDQSEKYRYIYQAYVHKLQQINEMIVANKSVKKKLDIPRKPTRPLHRFFRNLDILKSMVRTWFQIEYKKFIKKSNKKLY